MRPPWPGMRSPKSLILKARLKPDAKKPPNGAISEAKAPKNVSLKVEIFLPKRTIWNWKGRIPTVAPIPNRAANGRRGSGTL